MSPLKRLLWKWFAFAAAWLAAATIKAIITGDNLDLLLDSTFAVAFIAAFLAFSFVRFLGDRRESNAR